MIRVSAPGLPPWPALKFDADRRHAVVSARIDNWKSRGWALIATECLVWTSSLFAALTIWLTLSPFALETRLVSALLGAVVIYYLVGYFFRPTVPGFLSRRVFATRLRVMFREDAIGISSPLFHHPLLIWRTWREKAIKIQFIVQGDSEASWFSDSLDWKQRQNRSELNETQYLAVLLSTSWNSSGEYLGDQESIRRSIPIAQLSGKDAVKFTMVLSAAATLTHPKYQSPTLHAKNGVDIDLT